MSFTIPNEVDAFNEAISEWDAIDLEILVSAYNGTSVISGCAVTAQGTPDMTVAVAAGTVMVGGTRASVAGGNVTITAADGSNPRLDLIVSDNGGTLSSTDGTAAANPVFPSIPANSVVLAAVFVPAGDTAIENNQITDKRVLTQNIHSSGLAEANTWTALQTFNQGNIRFGDTSDDHYYALGVSELAANRTITLPLLTGNDTFVFEAHSQTLTNKVVGSGSTLDNISVGPHGIGAATNSQRQVTIEGTFAERFGVTITSQIQPPANIDGALLVINGTIDEAGSGTHNIFAGLTIQPPTITAGGAALTNAISLYISNAPTGATNNYAFWVNDGLSRFDGNINLQDNVQVQLGTGSDSVIYYDGTDTFWDLRAVGTGDLMIALAGSFPSPDPNSVHIWRGNAGAITATAASVLIVENSSDADISLLTPNTASASIRFGDQDDANPGSITYDHANDRFIYRIADSNRLIHSAGAFAFQEATSISTTTGSLTISPADQVISPVQIRINAAGGNPDLVTAHIWFLESNNYRYGFSYNPTGNYLVIGTHDSDGGGTNADVIRIPDGALAVQFFGDIDFQQAAEISTTTGGLTLSPASSVGILTAASSAAAVQIGSFTVSGNADDTGAIVFQSTITGATGAATRIQQMVLNGAINNAGENYTIAATLTLDEPNLAGAGSWTNASSLYIIAAPTEATNNYALWVDSGITRLDDPIALGGGSSATLGTIGGSGPATAGQNQWLRININGTDNFIPVWQ